MTERRVEANGVELCTEAFGRPGDQAVLLIMGAMAPMTRWEDDFCARLADRDRYVLRYDHRDTGRSTTYPHREPGYDISELVDDAAAVLDAHDVEVADVVGMSLGGMVAQRLALRHPVRVRSLVALMTMPWAVDVPDAVVGNAALDAHFQRLDSLDWSSGATVVDWITEQWRLLAGTAHPFDEPHARALAELDVRRAADIGSMANHAVLAPGLRRDESIADIRAPLLVVHGTADPMIPFACADALVAAVPGAELLALTGTGHELHRQDWEVLIDAIVDHGDHRDHGDRGDHGADGHRASGS